MAKSAAVERYAEAKLGRVERVLGQVDRLAGDALSQAPRDGARALLDLRCGEGNHCKPFHQLDHGLRLQDDVVAPGVERHRIA